MSEELAIASRVVVGHDGSAAASAAVRWAATLAHRLGVPCQVVRAWSITTAPRPASQQGGYIPPEEDFAEAVVLEVRQQLAGLDLPVEVAVEALRGKSSEALIDYVQLDDLLVVGERGAGGFRGLIMGSTAEQVVAHARCPVVVIPAP